MESTEPGRNPHVRSSKVFRKAAEPELFPVQLEDLLPSTDLSVYIRKALDTLDTSELKDLYEDHGGVAYDPVSMLGILLLGYSLGVTGSRELQSRCLYDVRFMHVARGAKPDDRTLCRFRRRISPYMDSLFIQVLNRCQEEGLTPMRRVALDGTKMASAASQYGRWKTKCETLDEEFIPDINLSDPDAMVLTKGNKHVLGYNLQAVVDVDSHIVLAVDISDSEADRGQLAPMLERTQALTQWSPDELVVDAGYDSHEGYSACHGCDVLAHAPAQDKQALFWTVVSENEIVCPMGKPAELMRKRKTRDRPLTDVYGVKGCKGCMLYDSCVTNRFGKVMYVPEGKDPTLRVLAAHRAKSPEGRAARLERMSSVETLFGRLKANLRLGRFKLRGMNGARLEVSLMAISQNLRTLARA